MKPDSHLVIILIMSWQDVLVWRKFRMWKWLEMKNVLFDIKCFFAREIWEHGSENTNLHQKDVSGNCENLGFKRNTKKAV